MVGCGEPILFVLLRPCRNVLDALNGIAFDDDKQVVELRAKKMYSDRPRVVVKLHPYPVIEKIRNLYRIGKEIRK